MLDFNHIRECLASSLGETLWPTRCIGCDEPGTLLCPKCAAQLPYIDLRASCPRCGAPYGKINCTECADFSSVSGDGAPAARFPFVHARAACTYEGVAKELILDYKDGNEVRLDALVAELISGAISGMVHPSPGVDDTRFAHDRPFDLRCWADALVAIPTSAAARRRRGYDHMERVARHCARSTGLPLLPVLRHARTVADQRTLGARERKLNRQGSFELAEDVGQLPPHIVLVDDVFTTGATTSAAAAALVAGGAREVVVTVAARVW